MARSLPQPSQHLPLHVGRGRELFLPPSRRTAISLLAHYASHPDFIQPVSRRNEIQNLVETELSDDRHYPLQRV